MRSQDGGAGLPAFKSEACYLHPRGGMLSFVVRLDRDTNDFAHLIGHEVMIDDDRRTCAFVERFTRTPSHHAGERIRIVVRPRPR